MKENKRWKSLLAEAITVVFSILLAFGIDASWDAWKADQTEYSILKALQTEMENNRNELEYFIGLNKSARTTVGEFLRMSPQEILQLPPDSLSAKRVHVNLWAPYTFDPERGATTVFLDREASSTESVRALRRATVDWDRVYADTGEELAVLWQSSREILKSISITISDLKPEGEVGLNIILQDYAARMAQIRSDEEIMGAVIAKFNLQTIYYMELEKLLEKTDLILELLEEMDL